MSENGAPTAARQGLAAVADGASLAGLPVTALPEYLPGVFAAQSRQEDESGGMVHLFPLPELGILPCQLVAYCDLLAEPAVMAPVRSYVGAPCVACLLTAPTPHWADGDEQQ